MSNIKGFAAHETIGIGVVNMASVRKLSSINGAVHVFDVCIVCDVYNVYYESYRYVEPSFDANFDKGYYHLTINRATPGSDVHTMRNDAIYSFTPSGIIIKDRNGDASNIWLKIKDMVGIHQIMES